MIISKDSNTSLNTVVIMAIAGALATTGIATNATHLVIGGMLVAPGFMPVIRISLNIVAKNQRWHLGLIDIFKGYLALMAGAVITTFVQTL